MDIVREVELDVDAGAAWELLSDPEELAGWVGDEVRGASVAVGDRSLSWTWAPNGVESTVEVTLTRVEERTVVRVVERSAGAVCALSTRIDDALLALELKALTWQHRLVRT
jgi:uncharacterized protein YndB with AHSA1/START domain